eukprot:1063692-Ditylum_brightwellii.AAC.1
MVSKSQSGKDSKMKKSKSMNTVGSGDGTAATYGTSVSTMDEDDRYIAVWENHLNPLTFETDLRRAVRRSEAKSKKTSANDDNSSMVSSTSSMFAPKSFEVTIALASDDSDNEKAGKCGRVALPFGVSTIAISGDECLNGKALMLDLPVLSLQQAKPFESGQIGSFPLIVIGSPSSDKKKSQGVDKGGGEDIGGNGKDGGDVNAGVVSDNAEIRQTQEQPPENSLSEHEKEGDNKKPKKKLFGKFFKRKSSTKKIKDDTPTPSPSAPSPLAPSPLAPSPIVPEDQIQDKPYIPTAEERAAFSSRYGIDQSGDAVLRVAIEIFEKGSDLERLFKFRQKQMKERILRKKLAKSENVGGSKKKINESPNQTPKHRTSSAVSPGKVELKPQRSLIDCGSDDNSRGSDSDYTSDSNYDDDGTFDTFDTFDSYYSGDTSYDADGSYTQGTLGADDPTEWTGTQANSTGRSGGNTRGPNAKDRDDDTKGRR